jgi:hypothetical protein
MPDSDAYFDHVNKFVGGRSQTRSATTYPSSAGGAVAKVIICKRMPIPRGAPYQSLPALACDHNGGRRLITSLPRSRNTTANRLFKRAGYRQSHFFQEILLPPADACADE